MQRNGIYEDTVIRQMKAFVEEIPYVFNCAATGQEIAIDPDGNIAACQGLLKTEEFPFRFDNCRKPENTKKFKEWVSRSPFTMNECWDCIALGICVFACKTSNNRLIHRCECREKKGAYAQEEDYIDNKEQLIAAFSQLKFQGFLAFESEFFLVFPFFF